MKKESDKPNASLDLQKLDSLLEAIARALVTKDLPQYNKCVEGNNSSDRPATNKTSQV